MGLFSFLGEITAEAVGTAMGEHKRNKRIQKNQANLAEHQGMINADRIETVSAGKQTVYDMRLRLYKEGLEFYGDRLVEVLSGFTNEKHDIYAEGVLRQKDMNTEKISAWAEEKCEAVFLNKTADTHDKNYKAAFSDATDALAEKLKTRILSKLKKSDYGAKAGRQPDYRMIPYLLYGLRYISKDDGYLPAIDAMNQYNYHNHFIFTVLHENEYGSFDIDSSKYFSQPERYGEINRRNEQKITTNDTGYFEGVAEELDDTFLWGLGARLWYYADKTPFDKEEFYEAVDMLNSFKNARENENCLECVLAEIYMKNKLGGEDLVRQNIDEIMSKAEISNPLYARSLCSFLAWLGTYNVEYEVLKRVVAAKIELTQEMQDRLSFLANGGTSNKLKVYNVQATDKFVFDSSTEGWSAEEFDALLSKFRMDRRTLNYSLLINSWKKTLPLAKGKKFSTEALDREFADLMDDFEGEITYEMTDAAAVDIDNVKFDGSALFRFCTKRNKGLTIMFNCEKFGRNLNINILTMFTPSDDIADDEMIGCIKAILSNPYIDSFRESILQAVDEAMTEKEALYDDKPVQPSPKMFE